MQLDHEGSQQPRHAIAKVSQAAVLWNLHLLRMAVAKTPIVALLVLAWPEIQQQTGGRSQRMTAWSGT